MLHNYGAIQALERLLGLLAEDGFILINDYGPTQVKPAEEYEHQRFSQATSIGLNFPLLKAYFADERGRQWHEPPVDNESIHARLLGHAPAAATVARFAERFTRPALEWLHEPAAQARQLVKAGRFEAAAVAYGRALERQPANWALMSEAASFLTFSLRDAKAGVEMARAGLALNPMSAELWNALGDALTDWGRLPEARQAYLHARRLNGSDPRTCYGLAWVHAAEKDYPAAPRLIAEGLALDWRGEYRERLLHKQDEVLGRLAQRHHHEHLRMANRVSSAAEKPGLAGLDARAVPPGEPTPLQSPDPVAAIPRTFLGVQPGE